MLHFFWVTLYLISTLTRFLGFPWEEPLLMWEEQKLLRIVFRCKMMQALHKSDLGALAEKQIKKNASERWVFLRRRLFFLLQFVSVIWNGSSALQHDILQWNLIYMQMHLKTSISHLCCGTRYRSKGRLQQQGLHRRKQHGVRILSRWTHHTRNFNTLWFVNLVVDNVVVLCLWWSGSKL